MQVERERVANEERGRQLRAETDRVEALKAKVAQLEQQAEQAKTVARSEVEKATEAKTALADHAKVASKAPPRSWLNRT